MKLALQLAWRQATIHFALFLYLLHVQGQFIKDTFLLWVLFLLFRLLRFSIVEARILGFFFIMFQLYIKIKLVSLVDFIVFDNEENIFPLPCFRNRHFSLRRSIVVERNLKGLRVLYLLLQYWLPFQLTLWIFLVRVKDILGQNFMFFDWQIKLICQAIKYFFMINNSLVKTAIAFIIKFLFCFIQKIVDSRSQNRYQQHIHEFVVIQKVYKLQLIFNLSLFNGFYKILENFSPYFIIGKDR